MKTADLKPDERYWVKSTTNVGKAMVASTQRWCFSKIGGRPRLLRADKSTATWRKPGLPVIGFGAWDAVREEQAALYEVRRAQLPGVTERFRERLAVSDEVDPELPKGFIVAVVQPQAIVSTMAQREADEKAWREADEKAWRERYDEEKRVREEGRLRQEEEARERVREVLGMPDFQLPHSWVTLEQALRLYASSVNQER